MCRNCSLSFCSVKEFLVSSDMNCFDDEIIETCKILFSVSARLVPRCGVERNMMAEIASTMALYSGSYWPCM